MLSGSQFGKIKIFKRNEQNLFDEKYKFQAHSDDVNALIELPNNQFASGSKDKLIRIWKLNIETYKADRLRTLTGHTQSVRCLTHLSSKKTLIISGSQDSTIRVWNYEDSNVALHTLNLNSSGQGIYVYSLAHLKNTTNLFASGLGNNQIKIYKIKKGKLDQIGIREEKTLEGHRSDVRCLTWLENESRLASGSMDRSVKIWDPSGNLPNELTLNPASNIYSLVYFKQ